MIRRQHARADLGCRAPSPRIIGKIVAEAVVRDGRELLLKVVVGVAVGRRAELARPGHGQQIVVVCVVGVVGRGGCVIVAAVLQDGRRRDILAGCTEGGIPLRD